MYMGSRKSQKKRFRFSGRKSSRWFTRRVVRIGGGSAGGGGHGGDHTHEDNVHDAHQINEDEIQVEFCDNTVRSAKYTILTFWFLNLFEQFRRVANFYFLIVAVVQLCLPSPPVSPFTSVFPLVFVVVVTMIKQGYEDVCRHRNDREINTAPVNMLDRDLVNTTVKKSKDIKVGDIVLVKINETFPADLVVLCTAALSGKGYVMTANLDGETNLKPVFASKLTKHCKDAEDLCKLAAGQIECESPNPDLTKFTGKIRIGNSSAPLSLENLVMRGTKLRNTEYVYGCAVYTGRDTKMSRNSKITANKFSTVEKTMNKFLLFFMGLLVFEIVFSTTMKYLIGIDLETPENCNELKHWYLGSVLKIEALQITEDFFSYLVIYNYIIPISLYVTLEFQKFVGGKFLQWDKDLVDEETGEGGQINSSDLNEELGQIEVLFSDKTGTLTENIMVFKEASIRGRKYKYDELLPSGSSPAADHLDSSLSVNTDDSLFDPNGSYRDPMDENEIVEFLRALALCHTVQVGRTCDHMTGDSAAVSSSGAHTRLLPRHRLKSLLTPLRAAARTLNKDSNMKQESRGNSLQPSPTEEVGSSDENMGPPFGSGQGRDNLAFEGDQDSEIMYNAASPDEKALVEACLKFGVGFSGEQETAGGHFLHLTETRAGYTSKRVYEKLQVLEFDSTRKRMSVILKNLDTHEIVLYTKGAESSVIPRCSEGSFFETNSHIDEYALVGLRTLAVATRQLHEDEYQHMQHNLNTAAQAMEEREAKIRKVYDEIEKDMVLLGATAVEDKLQDGVRDTLVKMSEAGIAVWILTGDKRETAVNISYSCGHLQPHYTLLDLTDQTSMSLGQSMSLHEDKLTHAHADADFALLVDGTALTIIFSDKEYQKQFFEVSIKCKSVICCRMSPLQKAEVVSMIKNSDKKPVTAAIGDGGNDVAMIQEAHVGLGIMGKEGRAAVRAADFAFPKFKHLQKVVLVHGHWYYYRVALLVQYFFYKNVACFSCQLYYAFFNSFSTQTVFDSVSLTLYNICYTSLPIFLFSLMEQNLSKEKLLDYPGTYKRHFRNKLLRWREFFLWFSQALWHSLVFFFGWLFFWSDSSNKGGLNITSGLSLDQVSFGTAMYASIVTLVNLRLLFQSRSWNVYLVLSIIGSILFYILFTFAEHSVSIPASWASAFLGYNENEIGGASVPLDSATYWVYHHVLSSISVWLFTLLLLVVAISPDIIIRILRKHWGVFMNRKNKKMRLETEDDDVFSMSYTNKAYLAHTDSFTNRAHRDSRTNSHSNKGRHGGVGSHSISYSNKVYSTEDSDRFGKKVGSNVFIDSDGYSREQNNITTKL